MLIPTTNSDWTGDLELKCKFGSFAPPAGSPVPSRPGVPRERERNHSNNSRSKLGNTGRSKPGVNLPKGDNIIMEKYETNKCLRESMGTMSLSTPNTSS